MLLLRFTVRNHLSLRDEVCLDLITPSLRTLQPKDQNWTAIAYPLAGILGGNATGKSAILDALMFTIDAIKYSSTTWQTPATEPMWRKPFALAANHETSTSSYELEFVVNNRRYSYGFEIDNQGIVSERLQDVPSTRWRTLFDRTRHDGEFTYKFHPTVRAVGELTDRELVLSRAHLLNHPTLHPIANQTTAPFEMVGVKNSHREKQLTNIAEALVNGTLTFADVQVLLQVADVGVTKVGVKPQSLPEDIMRALLEPDQSAALAGSDQVEQPSLQPVLSTEHAEQVIQHLTFTHHSEAANCPEFSIHDQSDGTVAWLRVAVPALHALRRGGVLIIDEIDASLHPHLLAALLGAFADPLINTRNAQLVFTSHESFILSPLSDVTLAPEQIWFTDKAIDGATDFFCLADYPKHPDANIAKRYLTGRYGGTPRLAPSLLASLTAPHQ